MNSFAAKSVLRLAAVAVSLSIVSAAASAQTKPTPAKPAAPAGHSMDHGHDMKEPATGWKELDAFHELMAASWHPAKGQNDLKPAKAKAADLAKAAKTWSESKAPKGCDTPKIADALKTVNTGTQEYAALVAKGADDATIKAKLSGIHDSFEVVEMGCKPEHGHK